MQAVRWPLRSETKRAVRASGLLMSAGLVGGLGNLVFNLMVARGGGAATYGAVGSLLMLAVAAGFCALGAQYAVAHLAAVGAPGARLLGRAFWGVAPWMALSFVVLVGAVPLASYLHLGSVVPVLLTALLLGVTVLAAAPAGLLVGRSRFRAVAVIAIGSTVVRILLGAWLGHGPGTVVGALVATVASIVLALLVRIGWVIWSERTSAKAAPPAAPLEAQPGEGAPGLMMRGALGALIAGGLWGIWTLPVLAARHKLDSHQSGEFAAAQLLAGGIIWGTAPLVTAFYPTLARGRNQQAVVVGLVVTAAVAAVGVLGFGLVGPALIPRVYGPEFHPAALLLFDLGTSAAVTAVMTFVCWSAVAQRRIVWPVIFGLGGGMAGAVVLCAAWAHSTVQLAASPSLAMALGALVAGGAKVVMNWRSVRPADEFQTGKSVRA
ncbi:MAG TPA: hypothetical protein VMW80_03630 [Candidatus Dormibacteraeota bacterium]|nr:hypothetical protein [Candidatus Dormibacteraeota bacterium]